MDISKLTDRILKAKKVFLIGNGGSYANAVHIANDLLACGVKAFTIDPATLTAIGNDYGYSHIFSRWLRVVAESGDLLIALSGSGKSPNILAAIVEAEHIGMDIEKVFGAPRYDMQSAEEEQLWMGHEIMRKIREKRS